MKRVIYGFIVCLVLMAMASCSWPKVFVRSSQGWVTYDRLSHRLEIVWDINTATPMDSAFNSDGDQVNDSIVK